MEKQLPLKSKTVVIEGNEYTVKFPTTGEFIDIANRKSMYSAGQQSSYNINTVSGIQSYYLVEAIAFFSVVLEEELQKDLNVKSLFELDMIQSKSLVDIYVKEIAPWVDEWLKILNSFGKEEDNKKSKKNEK